MDRCGLARPGLRVRGPPLAGDGSRGPPRGKTLDPPGDPTIGACLAGRLSGPLSHRFGTPRDLVLGVTLVLGDGTVASSGGKVVKNVAGYDLGKLVCGSEGRLALINRIAGVVLIAFGLILLFGDFVLR